MVAVRFGRSRRVVVLLAVVHTAALLVVPPLDCPAWFTAALVAAIAGSLAWSIARCGYLVGASSIVGMEIDEDGSVVVQRRNGAWQSAELLPSTYVSSRFTVINLRLEGRSRVATVLVMRASCDDDAYRRLRIELRWRRGLRRNPVPGAPGQSKPASAGDAAAP